LWLDCRIWAMTTKLDKTRERDLPSLWCRL
jgi:hypothetical protein